VSFDTDSSAVLERFRSIIVPSADVLLGTGLTALTLVVGLTTDGIARAGLGLTLVLFLQGYAVVAALFPAQPADSEEWVARRVALPFGVSLALLPLLGLAFNTVSLPYTPPSVLGVTGAITLVGLLVAGRRRVNLPADKQGQSALSAWLGGLDRSLFRGPTADLLVNALTVVAVVTAMAGLVFAVVAPAPSPSYARFSVLTENASGELVASGYPTNFTGGEGQDVVVEIENQGQTDQQYTVVAQLQRFDAAEDTVTERSRLSTLNQTVGSGETWNGPLTVTPEMTGQRMRLAFLLYEEDVPANPTLDSAQEHLFLWVNVSDGSAAATGPATTTVSPPSNTSTTSTPNGTRTPAGSPAATPLPTATPATTETSTPVVPTLPSDPTPANGTETPTATSSEPPLPALDPENGAVWG
jgi:uncharacterized membrane protein